MAYRTKTSPKLLYTIYTTKHMPVEWLDRIRILAVARHETVEDSLNRVIALGVPILERETWGATKVFRQAAGKQG